MKLPIIEVKTNGACKAFIPFTQLPKASSGKRYRLVEVTADAETGAESAESYLNDVQCLDVVVAVGERVGMHAPGWDMVSPIELCRAFDAELCIARMVDPASDQ